MTPWKSLWRCVTCCRKWSLRFRNVLYMFRNRLETQSCQVCQVCQVSMQNVRRRSTWSTWSTWSTNRLKRSESNNRRSEVWRHWRIAMGQTWMHRRLLNLNAYIGLHEATQTRSSNLLTSQRRLETDQTNFKPCITSITNNFDSSILHLRTLSHHVALPVHWTCSTHPVSGLSG